MTIEELSHSNQPLENKYLYNGKELDTDFGLNWYHYGARMYDAVIGRFTGVDPIADEFASVSPYNYAENEPIANIDLWGLQQIFYGDVLKNKAVNQANELRVSTREGIKTNIAVYNSEKKEVAHDVYFTVADLSSMADPTANAQTTTFSSDAVNEDGTLKTNSATRQSMANRGLLSLNYKESKDAGNNFSVVVINSEGNAFKNAQKGGDEAILKLSETIHHELKAHVVSKIESNSIQADQKEEHYNYHGNRSISSPPIDQAKEGTSQKKFIDEAREIQKNN